MNVRKLVVGIVLLGTLSMVPGIRAEEPAAAESGRGASAAGFEDTHAVVLPKGKWGYRGTLGDVEVLRDGSLLFAYGLNGGTGQAIAARTSKDQGKTWGPEFILVARPKPHGKHGYYHPGFLRLANDDILLSYPYTNGEAPYYGHTYCRRSTDDGKSWGDQFVITPYPGYNLIHNDKLIQLASGRVIAPGEREHRPSAGGHAGYVSFVFYSDNDGYSWHRSNNEVNALPVEAQEPHVVELKDGRLMMLCRTYSGFVLRAYSEDQGVTWSKGEPVSELKLSANASALNVKRIPKTGDLLLLRTTGGEGGYRTPFVSVISRDEGKTWINERVIAGDPDNDYGYPFLTFLDDLALVGYHKRDGLWIARIGIDWFHGK